MKVWSGLKWVWWLNVFLKMKGMAIATCNCVTVKEESVGFFKYDDEVPH